MKNSSFIAGISLLAVLSTPAFAASPWNGTWKLNQAKSHMTGDTFTLVAAANGMSHYSNGSTVAYDYRCDGKTYTTVGPYALTCTQSSSNARVYTAMFNGTVTGTTHSTLSADGKTWTDVSTGTQPDGTQYSTTTVYQHVSGAGWNGTWKDVKTSSSVAGLIVFDVSGKQVKISFPGYKQQATAAIDGPPSPFTGEQLPTGVTLQLKSHGNGELQQQIVWKGKVYGIDIYSLSADGKTLTDVSWVPGKESAKQTYVYEKT